MRSVVRTSAALVVVASTLGVLLLASTPVAASHETFVVTSTGDGSDAMPGDGTCGGTGAAPSLGPGETLPPLDVPCTLRAAIEEANAHEGFDFIEFNIPGDPSDDGFYRIEPATALPTIIEDLVINGETAPGAVQNADEQGWDGVLRIAVVGDGSVPDMDGFLVDAQNVEIRGLDISGFDGEGVEFLPGAAGALYGNQIHDNGGHGVRLGDETSVTIGSTNPNDRNRIFVNLLAGIAVTGPTTNPGTVSHIRGNLINDNQEPSIDLGADGETANDPSDADAGPNGLQNHPSLTTAFADAGRVTIDGTLSSLAERLYAVDFFLTDACGGVSGVTDSGEGHYYLGSADVQTNADGAAGFRATLSFPDGVFSGQVSATATGPQQLSGGQQGTSEFSACVRVQQGAPPRITPNPAVTQQPLPSAGPDETVSEELPPEGGEVGTDVEGDGATPSDPVETSVTSPNGGTVTIEEASVSEPEPAGYTFFGQQVNITAPSATPEDPLVLVFRLDASVFEGEDPAAITVFREGVPLPGCTGADGDAAPDPCLDDRVVLADGDLQLTAFTSAASAWNFGVSDTVASPIATRGGIPNTAGLVGAPDLTIPAGLLLAASGAIWVVARRIAGARR